MIEATIRLRVPSARISESIVKSVAPDNNNMKGLTVKAQAMPREAKFVIQFDGRVETFISTMEDLLRCVQASNMTLQKIGKQRKN